ncbi:U4/U6 x U5 tri-snRNP complex subunit Prp1 [Friedmanniomyces endolithicus]|uniref:U4/U6 x U5 tri-snRNP complex subunit Prp1 n=1 Tax=Friedmanniomyces endolithicus TaxID=329885 RepID=A0AAN6JAB7_9PEZI|nr:U4/U6 x U5 tri-snRNP complex subunit Prp1 [Friedmanniomyces endolithicus]KAK0301285.1 U4/U6 x U5 tri-snRNP complex subunit Prp1 [Friedmanniomyces endolithicus]KAK0322201.1 U4/U6 x U5 tri-snRNP complex subunit Prp1 [Friedmanniomyces endolithicus]KAK1014529.1 U4/U6 x U5 tri-snRNP complex subunit Prp1 [Friedmanniomyces endolithicus]
MSGRKDFLSQPAPENYVAGLGRGATGFTTRSDLGPAREGPSEDQIKEALAKRAAQLGNAPPTAYGVGKKKGEDEADDGRFEDAENEEGLFATGNYDREDDEADRIYQAVDERMDRRRKARREARERTEQETYERNNPKIQQQFADLKRALGTVSDEDWASIPEVGDLTGKNRRNKQNDRQRFYAVPDSVLAGARDTGQLGTEIQDEGMATEAPNGSADQADGTMTNFADIGAARNRVMQVRLDAAAQSQTTGTDSVAGTSTNIDPKGYLTSLGKSELRAGETNLGDIKRARVLLESVIKRNPRHGPGWIAAARLEEYAGKVQAAQNVIRRGAEMCPKSEDVWLEAIRLSQAHGNNHNAKVLAAKAIEHNDRSVKLWIEAMRLEQVPTAMKRVLRKALDHIPQSVAIWKEAVNLEEDPNDAKLLLAKATEIIPLSVELWLALARLETPDQAQVVLNKARKAVPASYEIWIAAGRLQEQIGQTQMVFKVMERGIKQLARESAMLKREDWITQAEICEEEGAPLTCQAIVKETLGWGLDEDDDRKQIWVDDAKASINRGRYETARAIYAYAIRVFYNRKSVWLAAAELERQHGSKQALWDLLGEAVKSCPTSEVLWMQLAREKWQAGEVDEARRVLGMAFQQNPGNEDIWLAAVKLEADNGETEKARALLAEARSEAGTDRVWIKSVGFERQIQKDSDVALTLVNEGLHVYPKAAKLWMMKGQTYEARNALPQAREAYNTGTRACPQSVPLWLLASRLEERMGVLVKARSILDRARLAVPKNPELWTESVRLEYRAKNMPAAQQKMAQALQECPTSGLVWSERIWHLEARTQRKPRILEAIQKADNDPILFVTAARIFWGERKLDKAASWFQKAAILDPDYGDTWAWWYTFLVQHGTEEKRAEVVASCVANEPKHGEYWARTRKAPENAGLGVEEVLRLVAKELV